jgi:hypothetical protein
VRPVKSYLQTLPKMCVLLNGLANFAGKSASYGQKRIFTAIIVFIEEKLKRAVRAVNEFEEKYQIRAI